MPVFHTMQKSGNKEFYPKGNLFELIVWLESSLNFSQSTLPVSWKRVNFSRLGVAYCMLENYLCRFAFKKDGIWIGGMPCIFILPEGWELFITRGVAEMTVKIQFSQWKWDKSSCWDQNFLQSASPAAPIPLPPLFFSFFFFFLLACESLDVFFRDVLICRVCCTGHQGQLQ